MKTLRSFGIGRIAMMAVLVAMTVESASAESVMIKRKFDAGSTYLFETKLDVMNAMGGMAGMPAGQEMEMKFNSLLCRRESVKDGKMGKKEITGTFDRWQHNWEMMGNTLEFDSDDPDNEEAAPMIATIFGTMTGESYKYEVTRDGKVLNFSGMDEIVKKVDKKATMNMFWPNMKSEYSDKSSGRQFAEDPLLIYPNKEVSVGDSWKATSIEEREPMGKTTSEYTYKLDKITTQDGRKVAIISYTVSISGGKGSGEAAKDDKGGVKAETKGSATGTAVYDIEKGIIVHDKNTAKQSSKLPASAMGGSADDTVSIKTNVVSETRLITEQEREKQKAETAAKIAARKAEEEAEEEDDEDEDDEDEEDDEDDDE